VRFRWFVDCVAYRMTALESLARNPAVTDAQVKARVERMFRTLLHPDEIKMAEQITKKLKELKR